MTKTASTTHDHELELPYLMGQNGGSARAYEVLDRSHSVRPMAASLSPIAESVRIRSAMDWCS